MSAPKLRRLQSSKRDPEPQRAGATPPLLFTHERRRPETRKGARRALLRALGVRSLPQGEPSRLSVFSPRGVGRPCFRRCRRGARKAREKLGRSTSEGGGHETSGDAWRRGRLGVVELPRDDGDLGDSRFGIALLGRFQRVSSLPRTLALSSRRGVRVDPPTGPRYIAVMLAANARGARSARGGAACMEQARRSASPRSSSRPLGEPATVLLTPP